MRFNYSIILDAFQHWEQHSPMPPLTSATQEPAENNIPLLSIAVIFSSYGYGAISSLKGVFVHFLSSHFISQRGDHSAVVSRVHLVRFAGIRSIFEIFQVSYKLWHFERGNRRKTTQRWVICHFPITFQKELSGFCMTFTIALKSIQMHHSCWNSLVLRFPTQQPVVCPKQSSAGHSQTQMWEFRGWTTPVPSMQLPNLLF